MRWTSWAVLAAAALCSTSALAAEIDLEGIWEGLIVGKPAAVEAEILIELGRTPDGELVGTFDMPSQNYLFYPIDNIRLEGSRVEFDFRRDSETYGANALRLFKGEISEDGKKIAGEFINGEERHPFHLEWTAPAGTPRAEVPKPPLELLGEGNEALRAAFNRDRDHVRLVMTLSPT